MIAFDIVNYGLLFRYARLQPQLKASEENSNKIVASIRRLKVIEFVLYANLALYGLAFIAEIKLYNVIEREENNLMKFMQLRIDYIDRPSGIV